MSSSSCTVGGGTIALSILEAREACCDDGEQQRRRPPVDVLAAVESIRVTGKAATIGIHDFSGAAQVLVLGQTAVQKVIRSSMRRGGMFGVVVVRLIAVIPALSLITKRIHRFCTLEWYVTQG